MNTAESGLNVTRNEVVLATDAKGAFMAHVAIVSLLRAVKSRRPTRINLFTSGFGDEERAKIQRSVDEYDFAQIRFIDAIPAMNPYMDMLEKLRGNFSVMTWARCFIDKLLDDVRGKVLYIDTDVFVVDDVSKLLDEPMDGCFFAAKPETVPANSKGPGGRYQRLGLGEEFKFYFNAGVMVFDLDAYRAGGGGARLAKIVAEYIDRIGAPDQDALNLFAGGKVRGFHPRWNFNDGWLDRQFKYRIGKGRYHGRDPLEMLSAIVSPGIIHYMGSQKPWRANHRPERFRYERLMRELGYLNTRYLPGMTLGKYLSIKFYDVWHVIMRAIVRLRLAVYRATRRSS